MALPAGGNVLPDTPYKGTSPYDAGVSGQSNSGPGVSGQSIGLEAAPGRGVSAPASDGVLGQGVNGVHGISNTKTTATGGAGVWGENALGDGVLGTGYHGVHGLSSADNGSGVWGQDTSSGTGGAGVRGISTNSDGVHGESQSSLHAGVSGINTGGGYGVWAVGKPAGHFEGDVEVTGNIKIDGEVTGNIKINGDITGVNTINVIKDLVLTGADCAEQFDMHDAKSPQPGTIVVIDDEGKLRESNRAYDKRVAGVVSGAGEYRPAIVLDRRASAEGRASIALVGKVYCKVDAEPAPIAVGDLLTSSARPGFGMKATDSTQAFGAVIGKALKPFPRGQGIIPILVALQ